MLQPESRSDLLRVEIPPPEWNPLLMEVKGFVFMAEGADERQREVTREVVGFVPSLPLVRVQVLNHGASLSRLCPCEKRLRCYCWPLSRCVCAAGCNVAALTFILSSTSICPVFSLYFGISSKFKHRLPESVRAVREERFQHAVRNKPTREFKC